MQFFLLIFIFTVAHVCACMPCACGCLRRTEEGLRTPRAGITGDRSELFKVCWEPNLGSLKEQQPLLIHDPSLQAREPKFLTVRESPRDSRTNVPTIGTL